MGTLNLDALRAEAGLSDGHTLTVGGRTFNLPAILPMGAMEGETEDAFRVLFGEDADIDFLKRNLSAIRSDRSFSEHDPENPQSDFDAIAEALYGIKRPEAASPNREARRAKAKAGSKTDK